MDDTLTRIVGDLGDRVTGPMKFRLVMQPAMAAFFAIKVGISDAKAGRPPYFWGLTHDSVHRAAMIKDGWRNVGKIFILAVALDTVYQLMVLHTVYVPQLVTVAFTLAIVPYVLLRGLVTRVMRKHRAADAP
jgi:hypothetical protein